jgi:predicted CXXCH cytochrome family protein
MPLEWSVAGLLLAAALWPLMRASRSWSVRATLLVLISATVLGGLAWSSRAHNKLQAKVQFEQRLPTESRPDGYVKSETCRACHPEQHASWHGTFHRTMTQQATPAAVLGDFNNVTLTADGETYRFFKRGDEYWAEMPDPDWLYVQALQRHSGVGPSGAAPSPAPRVEKRVTMTTGSHHMQAYWVDGKYGNQQFSLPFTWLIAEQRWVPRNDVFLLPPERRWSPQVWNNNCLGCHATAGQPGLHLEKKEFTTRVAELGIACASCHGPGEEHVRANSDPRRRYAIHAAGRGDPTIVNPARLGSRESSQVCGQCHAARYSLEHTNWLVQGTEFWKRKNLETHRPLLPSHLLRELNPSADAEQAAHHQALVGYFWKDGMVRVSGREFNGLAATPCYQRGKMSCLSCHSMHKMTSPADQLARGMDSNRACYQCHDDYEKKLTSHTGHSASSAGSLCYNCHMPHTTYGLLKAIRSHEITSPTVKSSLETGRPNACNLCHLDKSLTWTAQQLNQRYRQPAPAIPPGEENVPASVMWLLRGDAGQRALIAWHMGWEPARQASGTNWLVPYLAETLDDPYSAVRYIGGQSLKRVPGFEKFPFDYVADRELQVQAKSRALQQWDPSALPSSQRSNVLPPQQAAHWLHQRDHRPVELLE